MPRVTPTRTPTPQEWASRKSKEWTDNPYLDHKDVGQEAQHHWEREKATLLPQLNGNQIVWSVERFRYLGFTGTPREAYGPVGHVEYRLAYWTVNRKGQWWWGQSAPILPAEDFDALVAKARAEGTIS